MTRRAMIASGMLAAGAPGGTRLTMALDCGSIGVKATQVEAVGYAAKYGFTAVSADGAWLERATEAERGRLLDEMKAKGLEWGQAGVSVEFRKGEEEFAVGLKAFPARAAALEKAGVKRVTTWIPPASDTETYLANLKMQGRRLRETAKILKDHGCRMGLEYVGPKTLWSSKRYPFVHTMKEMKELIAEIGTGNVGFVLDCWHWYTAGEGVAELKTLTAADVVSIDLNDAPAGIAVDQQKDSVRELPCATGVIPVGEFLTTLSRLGADAPARCEPFNAALRAMAPADALAATAAAMKKAFAQIG
ncbi:MAG: sugar phosphate isomerase/epimerase [Acidobacteria bacterium]|nr:sugar phosphate isomerase/epimerase [Acidobacteriota bacterium]